MTVAVQVTRGPARIFTGTVDTHTAHFEPNGPDCGGDSWDVRVTARAGDRLDGG